MTTETLTVMMPRALTAENGAKALLMGEFFELEMHCCPTCRGDDEDVGGCNTCDANGVIPHKIPVSWTTIKAIYAKAVEHFAT